MFNSQTYTREWIETLSKQNRNTDKILIEKVIQALSLLSSLNNFKLKFILKGGTALCISTRGQSGKCPFTDIQQGINRIKSYIFSEKYLIENVIVSASKAAYLACLIKLGNNQIDRIISKESIRDVIITNPTWNKLNKLKSGSPEAFWYWQKSVSFLK